MNPSIAELVEAVDALHADEVIVLPNNGNIRPVADRVEGAHRQAGVGGADRDHRRGVRRAARLRPRSPRRGQRRGHGDLRPHGGARRGDPGRARLPTARRDRSRPATGSVSPATASRWSATPWPARRARSSTSWSPTQHDLVTIIEGEGSGARRDPADHRVAPRATGRTWTPRSTTAASRCTRTCSPSSDRPGLAAGRTEADRSPARPAGRAPGLGPPRRRAAWPKPSSPSSGSPRCSTC